MGKAEDKAQAAKNADMVDRMGQAAGAAGTKAALAEIRAFQGNAAAKQALMDEINRRR